MGSAADPTIERVREHALGLTAKELPLGRDAFLDDGSGRVQLQPRTIVMVGGLIPCPSRRGLAQGDADDDGTVICRGAYGTDLREAIDGL